MADPAAGGSAGSRLRPLPLGKYLACSDRCLARPSLAQAAKLSSFQLEVSDALGQVGIEHELEYLTAVNLLSVDIAIVKGGAFPRLHTRSRSRKHPTFRGPRQPTPSAPQCSLVFFPGKKVAIEVDGPFHFSVNTNSPLGQTMIRRRLLRAVGWTVISVPYHTW